MTAAIRRFAFLSFLCRAMTFVPAALLHLPLALLALLVYARIPRAIDATLDTAIPPPLLPRGGLTLANRISLVALLPLEPVHLALLLCTVLAILAQLASLALAVVALSCKLLPPLMAMVAWLLPTGLGAALAALAALPLDLVRAATYLAGLPVALWWGIFVGVPWTLLQAGLHMVHSAAAYALPSAAPLLAALTPAAVLAQPSLAAVHTLLAYCVLSAAYLLVRRALPSPNEADAEDTAAQRLRVAGIV